MKSKGIMQNFIKYFVMLLLFLEIILGIYWVVTNIGNLILYPETVDLIDAAKTGVLDEYTGVFYPHFLNMFINRESGTLYYIPIYIIQLVAVYLSTVYVLYPIVKQRYAWMGAGVVLAIPMIIQCVLMVAPFSFCLTFILLMAGAAIRLLQKREQIEKWPLVVLLGAWFLASMTSIDLFFYCGISILVFLLVICIRKTDKKRLKKLIVCMVSFIIVCIIGLGLFEAQTEIGSRNRVQKSFASALWERTTWPNLGLDYFEIPAEVRSIFQEDEISINIRISESFIYKYGPVIDKEYGYEKANDLYYAMSFTEFKLRTKEIIARTGNDAIGYLFMPFSIFSYMNGTYGSITGMLYSHMTAGETGILYLYWSVSLLLVFICALYTLIMIAGKLGTRKEKKGNRILAAGIAFLICQAVYYAIMAPQGVDYRYVLSGIVFWEILVLYKTFQHEMEL